MGYLTEIPEKSKSTSKRASSNLGAQDMFYSNGFLPKVNVDSRNRENTRNEQRVITLREAGNVLVFTIQKSQMILPGQEAMPR